MLCSSTSAKRSYTSSVAAPVWGSASTFGCLGAAAGGRAGRLGGPAGRGKDWRGPGMHASQNSCGA
jgi:hypothetical protein